MTAASDVVVNRLLVGAGILVVVAVAATMGWFVRDRAGDGAASVPAAVASATPTIAAAPPANASVSNPAPNIQTASVAPVATVNGKPAPAVAPTPAVAPASPAAARTPQAPSFDVVRVGPGGDAVIAGRAAPHAEVVVRDGDVVLGTVTADGRGEWVLVPEKPLPPGNRSLQLSARQPGGEAVASASDVLIAVPERHRDLAGETTEQAATTLAMLVPRAGGDMVRPLQVPAAKGGADTAGITGRHTLSLDIVEYDAAGHLALAGRAAPGATVELALGETPIGRATAGRDGRWTAKPEGDVAPGSYQLRLAQIGDDGKIVERLALPFERAAPGTELADGQSFTVQPGNSLWRIARKSYGSGTRYAVIYAANRDHITNPDLIYPGQIVKLPQVGAPGG